MKLLFACVYLGVVAGCLAFELSNLGWEGYKLQFNKQYASLEEELRRKEIFVQAQEEVAAHNALYHKGLETYTMAINEFSDRFPEEMEAMKGYRMDLDDNSPDVVDPRLIDDLEGDIPASIDWRTKGAVTEVKNQKDCASCWAFSATGALEGQHFMKTKKLVSLSEQNLIDCDRKDHGCDGGLMKSAFQYVKKNGGIDTEASYSYKAKKSACHYKAKTSGANCTGYFSIPRGNETLLKAAVAKIGPVSVGINTLNSFRKYHGGVYYDKSCSTSFLDHAVLVVGYGTTSNGTDYWIVKNSWGKGFGIKGYILMSRNRQNNCGIATDASYPTE